MPIEAVATGGLSTIAEQGIVFTILVVIIVSLIVDRKRLLNDLKELSTKVIATLEANGEKYASVVERNSTAFSNLAEKIDVLKDIAKH